MTAHYYNIVNLVTVDYTIIHHASGLVESVYRYGLLLTDADTDTAQTKPALILDYGIVSCGLIIPAAIVEYYREAKASENWPFLANESTHHRQQRMAIHNYCCCSTKHI